MMFIRQGATHKVVLGPFVDVGDGFTPETGVALSTADEAEAILHDNGTVVDISGYTWAAIATADGYYHLTLQSGISSTVGHLTIIVQDDSVCLPVKADFMVLEEAVYDQLFAALAPGAATVAALATAQTDLDTLTGSDGATLATSQPNYAPGTAAELAKVPKSDGTASWNATALAAINAECDMALADYDAPTKAELDSGLASLNDPTSAMIADAVWDEARVDHATSGTFGQGAASVQGNVTGSTASVTGAVGSVTGNVGGNVAGSVGSLATQAKADVNAELVDALNTDTYAEPGQEAPGATVSLVKKIGYLYKAWRNKSTQTATEQALYNAGGSVVDQKATVSDDDTTFTKGEMGTGP